METFSVPDSKLSMVPRGYTLPGRWDQPGPRSSQGIEVAVWEHPEQRHRKLSGDGSHMKPSSPVNCTNLQSYIEFPGRRCLTRWICGQISCLRESWVECKTNRKRLRLAGTYLVQPSAPTRAGFKVGAGCSRSCLVKFLKPPRMETPPSLGSATLVEQNSSLMSTWDFLCCNLCLLPAVLSFWCLPYCGLSPVHQYLSYTGGPWHSHYAPDTVSQVLERRIIFPCLAGYTLAHTAQSVVGLQHSMGTRLACVQLVGQNPQILLYRAAPQSLSPQTTPVQGVTLLQEFVFLAEIHVANPTTSSWPIPPSCPCLSEQQPRISAAPPWLGAIQAMMMLNSTHLLLQQGKVFSISSCQVLSYRL